MLVRDTHGERPGREEVEAMMAGGSMMKRRKKKRDKLRPS